MYIFWDTYAHDSGLVAVLHCSAWDGLQAVILERFVMQDFLEAIQKYKTTFAFVVPPIILALAKNPLVDKYNLSSMKMMNSGAAPYDLSYLFVNSRLTKELVEEMYTRTKIPVKQGYGLTEYDPVSNTLISGLHRLHMHRNGSTGSHILDLSGSYCPIWKR
jgi:4-coumarate--CoA ligase